VGAEHIYALEPPLSPAGGPNTRQEWIDLVGETLRLRIEGRKQGWERWVAVGELETGNGRTTVEVL